MRYPAQVGPRTRARDTASASPSMAQPSVFATAPTKVFTQDMLRQTAPNRYGLLPNVASHFCIQTCRAAAAVFCSPGSFHCQRDAPPIKAERPTYMGNHSPAGCESSPDRRPPGGPGAGLRYGCDMARLCRATAPYIGAARLELAGPVPVLASGAHRMGSGPVLANSRTGLGARPPCTFLSTGVSKCSQVPPLTFS